MNHKWYQIKNVYHKYKRIIKKHNKNIKYKQNEQQYTKTRIPARCWAVYNGWTVWCRNPLWGGRSRGNTTVASWAVTIRTPDTLSRRERKTPYLLKGEYRDNGNSGAFWFYTFILVVVSSIYFLIYCISLSLWNSWSTCLHLSSIIFIIFLWSKCS